MKIAIATKDHWTQVSGHAGQTRDWLLFDCQPDTCFDITTTLCKLRDLFSRH